MSFVQSHADPSARAKAVIVVGGVHALLGAGLVLGLTFTELVKTDDNPDAIIIDAKPTPEPTPDPQPTAEVVNYTPVTAPIPPIPFTPPETSVRPTPEDPPVGPTNLTPTPLPTPTYAPDPPRPTPSFTPVSARPRNGPAGWISTIDYPSTPLRRGEEGTAGYRLVIGSNGRVDECQITASTGSRALDTATCRFLEQRARFDPARDQTGRDVVGTYTGQVTWQIPD